MTSSALIIASFVVVVTLSGVLAANEEQRFADISVRIQESIPVDPEAVAIAIANVTRIYRHAGIVISWAPLSSVPRTGVELTLVMVSNSLAEMKDLNDDVMGVAHPGERTCGRIAFVFYNRIEAFARLHKQELPVVLAPVIAHELGHLLLPQQSHSPTGIMRANLRPSDLFDAARGIPRFTDAQGERMRARIAAEPLKGAVVGVVRDAFGIAVAEAHITVTDLVRKERWEAIPDARGWFRFERLPLGSYRLAVTASGYADHEHQINLVAEGVHVSATLTRVGNAWLAR